VEVVSGSVVVVGGGSVLIEQKLKNNISFIARKVLKTVANLQFKLKKYNL
jgi:hypothetical protein